MLFRPGLYSANIVLSVSYLLIVQSIICYKNQKHFNQFTMSLLFCVILFYMIFLVSVSISLVARNRENQMVGVLFRLTDYAYWLYVTDTEGNIDI